MEPLTTEGIKCAGSKLKILPSIIPLIQNIPVKTVLDGFSGSTRVSQALAQLNYCVHSNDVSVWSETLATCYLLADKPDSYYLPLLEELNALPGISVGLQNITEKRQQILKKAFQVFNTKKLDAIRSRIGELGIDKLDASVLLTSLILALDKVDSTMGHYTSYLNKWSPRSYKTLKLELPKRIASTEQHVVTQTDVFNLLPNHAYDLAYFDPPYGSNNDLMPSSRVRYNSYYHFWTTVVLNDQPPVFGSASRRLDTKDTLGVSEFESYKKDEEGKFEVVSSLNRLIASTKANYILLSYSSAGRASKVDLYDVLTSNGRLIKSLSVDYKKNVMSAMRWTNKWVNSDGKHLEYLFLLEKCY